MRRRHHPHRIFLVVALASACAAADPPGAAACGGTLEAHTTCLINAERAVHGLRPLVADPQLAEAARAHAGDMVARGYFSHRSPSGATCADRVRRTGFLRGRRRWALGEILAWGTGALATPASVVQAWMRSPSHRAVMLRAGYRRVGVGVITGTPASPLEGATYAAELARRAPPAG